MKGVSRFFDPVRFTPGIHAVTGTCLLVVLSAAPLMADQCQSIKDKMTQLQLEIDKESEHLYSPCCRPGLPAKPIKDPEVQKQIDATKKLFDAARDELAKCDVPPPAPAPAIKGFTAQGIRVPDPQIAVGHKYFAAIDTSEYVFYEKSTQHLTAPTTDGSHSIDSLFSTLYKAINEEMLSEAIHEGMKMPTWLCDPEHPELQYKDKAHTLIKSNFGCIGQTYDARVIYDAPRHRFWIATALRPFLWSCNARDGRAGLETEGPAGVIWDPDPIDPSGKTPLCHSDWSPSWMHRFAAVAISETNSAGEEDLTKPFHLYVLTETLGDWPQMSVNDHFLVINHFDTKHPEQDPIEIFDAEELASGVQNGTVLKVKPVKTIALSELAVQRGSEKLAAGEQTFLVNNHGSSDGVTYMISTNGNNLLIFGVKAPSGNSSATPQMLAGTALDLGHPPGSMRNNAVFRDGKIYAAAFACAQPDKPCTKYVGRILRVPVEPSSDGKSVHAFGPNSEGFLDYVVGQSNLLSYENTLIEVTADRDIVFGFESVGLESGHLAPAAVKYGVFYHDKGNISEDGTIQPPEGNKMPDPRDPGQTGGVIDLGGIALDPSDNKTVWISHAYSKNGVYTEVVGAVKP